MTTPKPYKTLIHGTLVQTTALSVGGNDPHAMADAPLARDGAGRLILRGTGIAGAFIASARAILAGTLPASITAGNTEEQHQERQTLSAGAGKNRLFESVWRFYHSHLESEPTTEIRTGVGIRQDTGAAADGIKFDTEIIPAGTRWPFLLEIDEYRDTSDGQALPIALRTIHEWQQGRCFLGRDVARGLGWCDLEEVTVYRLTPDDAMEWPNAGLEPLVALKAIPSARKQPDWLESLVQDARVISKPRLIRSGTGIIHVGLDGPDIGSGDATPWGLDTLSLGGGEAMLRMQQEALDGILTGPPTGKDQQSAEPDLILAWTRPVGHADTRPRPFLPGAGLRGPLRHTLAWWRRRQGDQNTIDPNTSTGMRAALTMDNNPASCVDRLFGTARHSGALLLSDAEVTGPDPIATGGLWLIEQHAEDEFTASTCGAQKFNRLALIKGSFRFRYFIEARDAADLAAFDTLLDTLQRLGAQRQVPLGGGQWRGHGWVRWEWQPDELHATTPAATAAGAVTGETQ